MFTPPSPNSFRVQWRRPKLRFGSGRLEDQILDAAQIYASIALELDRLSQPEHSSIEILMDGLDWLIDALNGTKAVVKHKEEFRSLLFQLLRYKAVSAAKGSW
jgi:hypothetical protein